MLSSDIPSRPADLDARVQRCRRVVDLLVEVGMKLVRSLDPEQGPAPVRDPFHAYCRISRALRLTLMIEARLAALADEGVPAVVAERRLAETSAENAEGEPMDQPEAVEASEPAGGGERDRQDPDEIGRFLSRPMTEVAAMVCRDFGLTAAEAGEAQAAFNHLIANDDAADDANDPDPSDPGVAALGEAGGRDLQRRTPPWSEAPLRRWPP